MYPAQGQQRCPKHGQIACLAATETCRHIFAQAQPLEGATGVVALGSKLEGGGALWHLPFPWPHYQAVTAFGAGMGIPSHDAMLLSLMLPPPRLHSFSPASHAMLVSPSQAAFFSPLGYCLCPSATHWRWAWHLVERAPASTQVLPPPASSCSQGLGQAPC